MYSHFTSFNDIHSFVEHILLSIIPVLAEYPLGLRGAIGGEPHTLTFRYSERILAIWKNSEFIKSWYYHSRSALVQVIQGAVPIYA